MVPCWAVSERAETGFKSGAGLEDCPLLIILAVPSACPTGTTATSRCVTKVCVSDEFSARREVKTKPPSCFG